MRHASDSSREFMADLSRGVEFVVRVVIRFAPIGIFGLVANTVASTGIETLAGYAGSPGFDWQYDLCRAGS